MFKIGDKVKLICAAVTHPWDGVCSVSCRRSTKKTHDDLSLNNIYTVSVVAGGCIGVKESESYEEASYFITRFILANEGSIKKKRSFKHSNIS